MKKKIIIVHQWGSNPKGDWYPWLEKELEKIGYEVLVPSMPNPDEPEIAPWVNELIKDIKEPNENTYFIAHSVGCQAVLRYLSSFESKGNFGGAIFVAPWLTLKNLETEEHTIAKPWLDIPIDFKRVKSHVKKIVCFFSDDDPWVPLENAEEFKKKLGATTIIEKGKGHYTQQEGITQIQQVLDCIKEMAKDK